MDRNKDKPDKTVDAVRAEIQTVDEQIAALFEERMGYAAELAAAKTKVGAPIYDREKETEKLSGLVKGQTNPFIEKGLEEIFVQMLSISRKYQYQLVHQRDRYIENYFTEVDKLVMFPDTRVVYAGVPGSFTGMACEKFFGEEVDHYGVPKFKDVVQALNDGEADYGVLPIENSSAGDVGGVYDILLDHDVCIVGEEFVKVDHCLLGCPGTKIEDIRTVYSHPQGFMQCGPYLDKMDVSQISVENTSIAAEMVAKNKNKSEAAIASRRAAELYGLQILEEDINFEDSNETRFVILSKKRQYTKTAGKVSIYIYPGDEKSGILYHILSHFLYNGLNITHIESVPSKEKQWEYCFYMDISGNLHDASMRNALQGVREEVSDFKILGNY